jgi:hypothetical protein
MPAMLVRIDSFDYAGDGTDNVTYSGGAYVTGGQNLGPVSWTITEPVGTLAATVNTAIKAAAVAAIANYGITVAPSDVQQIVGAPVAL